MGGAVSSRARRLQNWSAQVRETRRQRRLMLQHYQTLINVLCLNELKEKVPDEALPTSEDFNAQEKLSGPNANEDTLDGDHAGLEREESDLEEKTAEGVELMDFIAGNLENGHDNTPVGPMEETRPSSMTERGRKRISAFAGRSIQRLVSSFTTSRGGKKMKLVDVFALPPENKKNSPTLWLQKALDAHDLVTYLESQIEDFLNEHEEELPLHSKGKLQEGLDCPEKLIRPGTILKGTIHIPGTEDRTAYELYIVRENTNELGDRYFVARHVKGADRDKQAVILVLDEDDVEQREIAYADLETTCHGFISQASVRGRMVENKADGEVDEFVNGEEGFFVERTEQHTFHLTRAEESSVEDLVDLNERLMLGKAGRAMAFAYWSLISATSKVVDESFPGRHIDWGEIMEDTIWLVEEVNANLRRQAELLNSLDFASTDERRTELEDLSKKGISRTQAHSSWDAATVFMNSIKDRRPSGSGMAPKYSDVYNEAEKSIERQTKSYERLDAALRTAKSRVCQSDIDKWASSTEAGQRISQDINCSICLEALEEHKLVLPCTHAFHVHCGQKWFHSSSFCPVCRTEYGNGDN